MLCTWLYVLHIDLKALDIGNPSSLDSPELSPCSPKLELCQRQFCWARSARHTKISRWMAFLLRRSTWLIPSTFSNHFDYIVDLMSNTITNLIQRDFLWCTYKHAYSGSEGKPSAKRRSHFRRQDAARLSSAALVRGSVVVVGLEYTLFGAFGLVTCRRAWVVRWSEGRDWRRRKYFALAAAATWQNGVSPNS